MANFVWIRNLALLSAAGGFGFYAYQGLKNVASIDPFSALRPKGTKDIPDEVLVQLKNVKLRHFQSGKLVTEATADSVDVNKDRVSFAMKGIRDGKSQTNRGPIRFSAKSANWNSAIKRLAMNDTARVQPASGGPDWHVLPIEAAVTAAAGNAVDGLSAAAAQKRLQTHGPNRIDGKPPRSPWLLFFGQFKGLLILVLVMAAALAAAIGKIPDADPNVWAFF
jgi:hypothetical protein